MLLRATGEASPGNTVSFLGRRITNKGDHFDISLDDEYVDNIFHEMKLNKCNPPTTAGSTTGKAIIEDEQLLDQQEHQQWSINNFDDLSENYNGWHTPGQSSATQRKNLQEFQQPTIKDQKKSMTSGQVSCRDKRLQIQHQTNSQALWQDATTTRLEHLCRLRLGRMSSDKTKHNRLCHRATWHLHPPWIRNTRSGSLVISWSWILCHQHWEPKKRYTSGASSWKPCTPSASTCASTR